ncbi:type II toxin-antitoxin system VapC family toxin [Sulfitobacter sp. 1A12126]|uniref:type II toxin-antitoxin system VapC family toxin n=2 Tax=unclassified Sulfitobacter TaxID=196795 RepID=UPI003748DC4A
MNIRKVLRATRAARKTRSLPTRTDLDLLFMEGLPVAGGAIMLDACVYIDQLQGKLPVAVEARITARSIFHSSVALSEICFPFGRLNPADPRTSSALATIEALIDAIPQRRILPVSPTAQARGAILAGVMARELGFDEGQRRKCLMDAMLAAHSVEEQLTLVTRNVADFDRLSQLEPKLKVVFYRH